MDGDRVAIVSSPRSGNTWLRWVLRDALRYDEIAVHNFMDIGSIPDRCVLQLHWYREPNFQKFLRDNGFRTIVISRHPLDLLISVLHFVQHEPETARWLEGNCEIPLTLVGKAPASDEFLAYALSFGAENLLAVTYQWWHDESALKVRYEDLVLYPEEQFGRIVAQLGKSDMHMSDVLRVNGLDKFRALPNRHGWQGRPGHWQKLIPPEYAQQIFARHSKVFEKLDYGAQSAPLTKQNAVENWGALQA